MKSEKRTPDMTEKPAQERREKKERGLKQLPDGRWQFSWKFEGYYHRRIADTKTEARACLEKIRTEIREGRYLDRKKEVKTTFEAACKRFLERGKVNLSDSTYSQDETHVKRWKASPHFKGKTLDAIRPAEIERFKADLRKQVGPRQTDYILSRLRRLFSICVKEELCERNPIGDKRVEFFNIKSQRDRYVTPEEEKTILENAAPKLRPAIIFSLHTGLRQGELVALTKADINLNVGKFGQVTVRGDIAKDREDRHIPLNATARAVLDGLPKVIKRDARLFAFLGSARDNLNYLWYRALRASGVNKDARKDQVITWHTLRHTYASRLVMAGVDLATVQKLLGHANITTTMRYAHLARPHVEDAVLVLDSKLRFSCNPENATSGSTAP